MCIKLLFFNFGLSKIFVMFLKTSLILVNILYFIQKVFYILHLYFKLLFIPVMAEINFLKCHIILLIMLM